MHFGHTTLSPGRAGTVGLVPGLALHTGEGTLAGYAGEGTLAGYVLIVHAFALLRKRCVGRTNSRPCRLDCTVYRRTEIVLTNKLPP